MHKDQRLSGAVDLILELKAVNRGVLTLSQFCFGLIASLHGFLLGFHIYLCSGEIVSYIISRRGDCETAPVTLANDPRSGRTSPDCHICVQDAEEA